MSKPTKVSTNKKLQFALLERLNSNQLNMIAPGSVQRRLEKKMLIKNSNRQKTGSDFKHHFQAFDNK